MLSLSSPQLSRGVVPTDASTGAHLIPMVDVGKERRTLLVHGHLQNGSIRYWNYLEAYWPCAGGLPAVNAIDSKLCGQINSGLAQ